MRFSNDGTSILAANELVDSVLFKFQRGAVISDLESEFGLTRHHLFYMKDIDSYSVQAFTAMIDARSAVVLEYDVKKLNGLLQSCISASVSDINSLLRSVDNTFTGIHTVDFKNASKLVELLYTQLDCVLDASKPFKLNKCCSADTLFLLSQLSGTRKTLIPFLLVNRNVISFKVNIQVFSFGLRSFNAKSEQVHEVIRLIKLGADYDFVKHYNGFCDVSTQYFKTVRKIYSIKVPSVEDVSVKTKLDVNEIFNAFLNEKYSYKDAVIATNKKSGLHIELINKILKRIDIVEEDDEKLEAELDELHRIL